MVLTNYKYIALLVVLFEIAIVLFTFKRNQRLGIYAAIISIFLKGQYIWVGLPIYAWHVAALFGLLYLAIGVRGLKSKEEKSVGFFRMSMVLYFIYSLLIAIPMWFIFNVDSFFGAGDALYRFTTQIMYFILLIGIFGFGVRAGNFLTTFGLLKVIIVIATLASYGAIFQVIVFNMSGIDLFPIIGSDESIRSSFILDKTFRATSFVGEPKHLGLLMSMGLIVFFLTRLFRVNVGNRFSFHMPLAMFTALILSLSSTGIAVAVAGVGVLAVVHFRRLRVADITILVSMAIILMAQVFLSGEFFYLLEGQINKSDFEIQDQSVKDALISNIEFLTTGTGLGNIHLLAVDFLPNDFPLFRERGYKANSGLFYVLGDSGLIGLVLLLVGPFLSLRMYASTKKSLSLNLRTERFAALALILVAFVCFLMRYDVFYFLLFGFVYSRLRSMSQDVVLYKDKKLTSDMFREVTI